MSPSGYDVMQEKEDDTPVVWKDFVGLCTHLDGVLEHSTQEVMDAHQQLQLQVKGTSENITAMQDQFTTFQQSIDQLTQSVAALHQPVAPPLVQPADEFANDDSVHDNANLLGPNGHGCGPGQQGWPPPVFGARRVLPAKDDYLGKPKFSIPRFDGKGDVEDYLTWELRIETLWHLHAYTKEKRAGLHAQNLMTMHCVGGIIF
jgi:hypothetical protein